MYVRTVLKWQLFEQAEFQSSEYALLIINKGNFSIFVRRNLCVQFYRFALLFIQKLL